MEPSREHNYEHLYDAVWHAAHLIFELPVCCPKDCITCAAVRLSRLHAKMSTFLSRNGVIPNKVLPADGANLDCGGAVVSFARETLGVDASKCGAHITGISCRQFLKGHVSGVFSSTFALQSYPEYLDFAF